MKQWLVAAPVLLGVACAAAAQEPTLPSLGESRRASANLAANATSSAARTAVPNAAPYATLAQPFETLPVAPTTESSALAAPIPAAEARSPYGDDNRRLEMGLAYAFVKFRSSPIDATMNGLNSSVAYFPTSDFAIEANATTAFGSPIFYGEHTKFLFYGAGAKYVERRATWEPWAHVLVGGVHMYPQTAAGSQNGLAVKFGGGVDYHWTRDSRISLRVEADLVRSQLYSQGQNNIMFATGIVIH